MGRKAYLITDEIYQLAKDELKNISKEYKKAIILKAIISAKEQGIDNVSKALRLSSQTIRDWVRNLKKETSKNLEYQETRGRKSNLTEEHHKIISEWVTKDCNITIKEIVIKLQETFDVKTSKSAVHRILQKLKYAYITPRPVHYKQNKEHHIEFQKKTKE